MVLECWVVMLSLRKTYLLSDQGNVGNWLFLSEYSSELSGNNRILGVDSVASAIVQDYLGISIVTSNGKCLLIL